jgi:hypothetical protein
LIDTQTGHVWTTKIDKKRNLVVLDSLLYDNFDGELRFIPNELNTPHSVKRLQLLENNSTNR